MRRTPLASIAVCWIALLACALTHAATFSMELAPPVATEPLDGRLLLLLSVDSKDEPRFQVQPGLKTQQIFGIDVTQWRAGTMQQIDAHVLGFPLESLAAVPRGKYRVQAVLHRYETFRRSDGHVVQLPMDRGEGQVWSRAPGNLYSEAREMEFDSSSAAPIAITLN